MSGVRKVVLMVFDGLRPDMVNAERTPHLHRFALNGTWHRAARSVFPSVTRVATSSIAAGAPPSAHGVVGNAFWMPSRLADRPVDTGKFADIVAAGNGDPSRFHQATTFADVVAAGGGKVRIVHTGSAGSAFLLNPRARENGHWTFNIHGAVHSPTPDAAVDVAARFGPLPDAELPRRSWCAYAARVFSDSVIPAEDWTVAIAWFPEPDTSYHYLGISHPDTLAMLGAVDAHFGAILEAIAARPDADSIAVIAASDHGQITVTEDIALFERMTAAGMPTAAALADGLMFLGVRGAQGELRLVNADTGLRDRAVTWLHEQPEVGQVFTRARNEVEGEAPGTFALELVGLGHERTADILFTLRSDEQADPAGLPGVGLYMGGVPVGGGMHGGLNRHELNTMLAIAAANVPKGVLNEDPSGIIDIAPTILGLLGLPIPASMRGRDLTIGVAPSAVKGLAVGAGHYEQRLEIADARYLFAGARLT